MTESKSLVLEKKYKPVEFIDLIREKIAETIELNSYYKELVGKTGFQLDALSSVEDLETIPYITTTSFKESAGLYDKLLKIPIDSPTFKHWNVSSCTSGDPSLVGVNEDDFEFLFEMARRCFLDFIRRDWDKATVFAFSPSVKMLNRIVARYTKIKPARSYSGNFYEVTSHMAQIEYLLKFSIPRFFKALITLRSLVGAFVIDAKLVWKSFDKNLQKQESEREYYAIGGSPQLIKKHIELMKEKNLSYNLGTQFDVVIGGGGWDGHKATMKYPPIDKAEWVQSIIDAFGTEESQFVDIYGFTESPVIFGSHWSSKLNDFVMHCPPYAKIIVRDQESLEPVKPGEFGLLEVLCPFGVNASTNHAVLVDDLTQFISKDKCPECGYEGSTFRVQGRIEDRQGLGCSSLIEWLK